MRWIARSVMIAAVCFAVAGEALAQGQSPIDLMTVAQGVMSGIEEPRQVVVRTMAEWRALWQEHGAQGAAPDVDVSRSMVVAVFLGTRPTAGFGVEITAVKSTGKSVVVEYRERRPAPGALTAQILTFPFHIVRIASVSGPIEFKRID